MEKVAAVWNDIEVSEIQIVDGINNALKIGESYPAKAVLDLKTLSSEDVGLEMVISAPGETDSWNW